MALYARRQPCFMSRRDGFVSTDTATKHGMGFAVS